MLNVSIISLYHRLEEYPSRYSLASLRLAAHTLAIPGVQIKIIPVHMNEACEDTAKKLSDLKSDVVGISAYLWTTNKVKDIAELVSNEGGRIIIGGPEVTNLDITQLPPSTHLVKGEGEEALRRF